MNRKQLRILIEQVVKQETSRLVGMSKGYLFKEQIMQQVQSALAAESSNIHTQQDFLKAVDAEIDKIKADLDLTFEMVARTIKSIPFEIFAKAMASKPNK